MTDSNPLIALMGEALIDLIEGADKSFTPCLGGAVYNLARALARQDVSTAYLNPFSSDAFGIRLAKNLLQEGVMLTRPQPVPQPTSLAVVNLDRSGHPQYAFYRDSVADRQITPADLIAQSSELSSLFLVCTGGLALDPRDASVLLPWLKAQRERGVGVAVDVNMRPSAVPELQAYRAHVLEVLTHADLAKVSDEDLDCLQIPGDGPVDRAKALFAIASLRCIALTLGRAGAVLLLRDGREYFWKDPVPVTVEDTVGAGDSFWAGLLARLLSMRSHADSFSTLLDDLDEDRCMVSLRHAVASASLCVEQRGCVPPSWSTAASRARLED